MYDLAVTNEAPGTCEKCKGTGIYQWGASVNGKMSKSGPCHSCRGTGKQDARQIARNRAYNSYKIALICAGN